MTWGYAQPAPFHKHVIPLDRGATSLANEATLSSTVVVLVKWSLLGSRQNPGPGQNRPICRDPGPGQNREIYRDSDRDFNIKFLENSINFLDFFNNFFKIFVFIRLK